MPPDFDPPSAHHHGEPLDPPLPSRQAMIDTVVKMIWLRELGDWKSLAEIITDDCEVHLPGIPGMTPFASASNPRGREASIEAVRNISILVEHKDVLPLSFIQDGDSIVLTWSGKARNRGTGPFVEVTGISRLRFRGRQIYFYSNHFDTAAVASITAAETQDT
jgi:hypothetical protein